MEKTFGRVLHKRTFIQRLNLDKYKWMGICVGVLIILSVVNCILINRFFSMIGIF
ncbi:MAG: hypothetical protein Q4G05_03240 [Clostridia bacterium]|nr:hypothetical protein [Clostridia bacterium]